MQEISVPAKVVSPPTMNTTEFVLRQAKLAANPALFSKRNADNVWIDVSAKEFLADVSAIAKGLIASISATLMQR